MTLYGIERREAMAAQLGINANQITSFRMDLGALRDMGAFVRVEVTGNSIWWRRADWVALGIAQGDTRQDRLTRGRRNLIRPERIRVFSAIEGRARGNLDAFGTPLNSLMPGMIAWRFLTVAAFHAWHARHQLVIQELEAAQAALIAEWDTVVAESRLDFTREAAEVWRGLAGRQEEVRRELAAAQRTMDTEAVQVLGAEEQRIGQLIQGGRMSFISGYVDNVLAQLPNAAQIQAVKITWYSNILESDIDMADLAAIERQAAEQRRLGAVADAEAQRIHAMRILELTQAQEYLRDATSPLMAAAQAAEQRIFETAQEILDAIARRNTLSRPLARRAAGLRELYELVRVTNRQDLEQTLGRLEAIIADTGARGPLNPAETQHVAALLTQVVDLTAREATDGMLPVGRGAMELAGLDLDLD